MGGAAPEEVTDDELAKREATDIAFHATRVEELILEGRDVDDFDTTLEAHLLRLRDLTAARLGALESQKGAD